MIFMQYTKFCVAILVCVTSWVYCENVKFFGYIRALMYIMVVYQLVQLNSINAHNTLTNHMIRITVDVVFSLEYIGYEKCLHLQLDLN